MSKLFEKGRLVSQSDDVIQFTASKKDDMMLLDSVVQINKAHVVMMLEEGIIEKKSASPLLLALLQFKIEKAESKAEDIHMIIEEEVTRITGDEIGGNLHIGKSRNDQVATAIRMTLRTELTSVMQILVGLQEAILQTAKKHVNTVIPGYTHTQPAQPITFAHYLLSFFDAFQRDMDRLSETLGRVNKSPMGAGALASTSFPINRERVAELLGFEGLVENSLDAVGSRDFMLEVQAHLAMLASTISRLAEDLILWSSVNFDTIDLPDGFASTSSIMPQKKNPDVLEVIRARTSDILGNFVSTSATLKGLPSGYSMDFQEITPKVWNSINLSIGSLTMLEKMLPLLAVKNCSDRLLKNFATSTEIANILVRKYHVAFRTAHKAVGILVREMLDRNLTFSDSVVGLLESILSDETGNNIRIQEQDILSAVDPSSFVKSHRVKGGPAPSEVARMLDSRDHQVMKTKDIINLKEHSITASVQKLDKTIESILSS